MNLPILPLLRESFTLVIKNMSRIFSSGLFFAVAIGLVLVFAYFGGAIFSSGELKEAEDIIAVIPPLAVITLLIMMIFAHLFNIWAGIGYTGDAVYRIGSAEIAFKRAFSNGLKMTLVTVVSLILTFIVAFLYVLISEAVGYEFDLENANISTEFVLPLIIAIPQSFVYSLFSASLTKTALGDEVGNLDDPDSTNFAVVLFLISAVMVVFTAVFSLSDKSALSFAGSFIMIFFGAVAAAAHGVRYRYCTHGDLNGPLPAVSDEAVANDIADDNKGVIEQQKVTEEVSSNSLTQSAPEYGKRKAQ